MAKINLLDASVYNRIAAGEVVERPASVVKELVENSIDAGATSIVVEIKRGGKDVIKVSDNGCGIEKAELEKAFMPHATSKIASTEDLGAIGTLGFRGEALSSIASVADVRVISKPAGQELGCSLCFSDGKPVLADVGSPDGTYFFAERIFSRIPARQKFMEKDFQEEAAVTDLMSRLILSHTEIAFRYLADGKKVYQSYGQGAKDALVAIYGAGVLEQVIEISAQQGEYRLEGFIGRESYSKPNRTYQTLIVNRRYVSNATVANAVYYAYADRLMKRQFPFFVLYLELPAEKVDVNVHPNKLDVRFVEKGAVYGFVNVNVAHALTQGYRIPDASENRKIEKISEKQPGASVQPINYVPRSEAISFFSQRRDQIKKTPMQLSEPNRVFVESERLLRLSKEGDKNLQDGAFEIVGEEQIHSSVGTRESIARTEAAAVADALPVRIIGVAFDTYLIVQMDNCLYWIDQHAAHERLLYDRIKAKRETMQGMQDLLLPYTFKVNAEEDAWLKKNEEHIRACGIDISEFGERNYKISAVPAILADMNLSDFTRAMLSDLTVSYEKSGADLLKDRLMQEACKAAVKGGDRLTEEELAVIMREIAETKATLMCPHGRPIVVKTERSAVEKWFKRIV